MSRIILLVPLELGFREKVALLLKYVRNSVSNTLVTPGLSRVLLGMLEIVLLAAKSWQLSRMSRSTFLKFVVGYVQQLIK